MEEGKADFSDCGITGAGHEITFPKRMNLYIKKSEEETWIIMDNGHQIWVSGFLKLTRNRGLDCSLLHRAGSRGWALGQRLTSARLMHQEDMAHSSLCSVSNSSSGKWVNRQNTEDTNIRIPRPGSMKALKSIFKMNLIRQGELHSLVNGIFLIF